MSNSTMMSTHPLVLIVDDNPEILTLYTYELQQTGFEVITAENGLRAFDWGPCNKALRGPEGGFAFLGMPDVSLI